MPEERLVLLFPGWNFIGGSKRLNGPAITSGPKKWQIFTRALFPSALMPWLGFLNHKLGGIMDISKLSKAAVLATLYNHATPLGMGYLQFTPEPMTEAEAQSMLDEGQTYFDYVKGRVMKVDLSRDDLRTGLYNRDNGENAAENALAELVAKAA